jgi:hypothetical protein
MKPPQNARRVPPPGSGTRAAPRRRAPRRLCAQLDFSDTDTALGGVLGMHPEMYPAAPWPGDDAARVRCVATRPPIISLRELLGSLAKANPRPEATPSRVKHQDEGRRFPVA